LNSETGKIIIGVGLLLVFVGGVVYFLGNKLHFIGNLPGDIRIEKDNFSFYFPITTMLLLSLILNVLIRIYKHFF
jgi:formate hydrogenlyase subunit 3/multisubunit Na+/H+ antiporter MnhD subunit